MKRGLRIFVSIIASLVMVFSSVGVVFAKVTTGDADHTGNFASDLPIGTVTIDVTNMGPTNPNMIFSSTNPEIVLDTTNVNNISQPSVAWRPNEEGNTTTPTLAVGQTKTLDGEVTLTWPGIATLQDGSTADVVMTISNINFDTPYRGTNPNFTESTLVGPLRFFWTHTNGKTYLGPNGNLGGTGMEATVNVKVVGAPEGATVLFSTVDLDVVDHKYSGKYNESFEVIGGAVSDIVVPNDSILDISGNKLSATAGDSDTYKTGFLVLADAKEGITLTWRGAGRAMGTGLFTGNIISHHIDSTSGKGGSIRTTTTGKVGEGTDLGPVRADVPDGKDVSYLLEPEKGFELDEITIDGTVIDPDDSSTWPVFIEVTKDESGNPIVTFKDNADNHTIDVSWNPIVTAKSGSGGSITDPGDTTVDAGDSKTYTATPKDGYTLGAIKFNGEDVDPEDPAMWPTDEDGNPLMAITKNSDGSWSIELKNVTDPTALEVSWNPIVTATSGKGGSISDPGDTTVTSGSSKTYTFTPEEGYEPDTVIVNGKEVTPTKNDDGTWSYTLENVTEPTTIEVTWKKIVIPVKFVDPITGKTIDAQSVEYGSAAKEPAPPAHPGYTFKGWDTVFDKITGETTVVAIYEPNKYTIKYDANGGTGTMDPQNFTGEDSAAKSKANAFTRDGYQFIGFKAKDADGNFLKDANGKDLIFKDVYDFKAYLDEMGDGAEITLVAQWKKITPVTKAVDTITSKKVKVLTTLVPRTGDGFPVGFCIIIALSAAVLLTLLVRKRKTR